MKYEDFKPLSRKTWEDEYKYLRVDRWKKMMEDFVILMKKNTYIECTPEKNSL